MHTTVTARESELRDLCRNFHVRRLELFGSAARGDFDADCSDLDFLVEFDPLPTGSYAAAFFGFKEALERLFERSVDLVVASAIRNPYFRQSVEQGKTLLYAA
ncbi:MAG: nucleotidyltransferase domain-containing protein [Acidobacteriaceae bacterium]